MTSSIVHATAVFFPQEQGSVLIRGPSGSGKSDLAFRLIEQGAQLVSDDQVALFNRRDKIYVEAIESIRGLLEVRGLGLLHYPPAMMSELLLVVDLVPRDDVPRLPEWEKTVLLNVALPLLHLHAFDASTAYKLRKATAIIRNPEMIVT